MQKRYDDFTRLWQELPTHAEYQRQQTMDAEEEARKAASSPREVYYNEFE